MGVWNQLEKLECNRFVPDAKDESYCACGREHHVTQISGPADGKWISEKDTIALPTDAHGTLLFDGPNPNKAHYVRLSSRTPLELVFKLLNEEWQLKKPKLIISTHGGKPNFQLPFHIKKAIREGLVRTAKSTKAWILTEGINTGISRRIGAMLKSERSPSLRGDRVVCIGIAPWGAIENRQQLIARNRNVVCSSIDRPRSDSSILNGCHSSFLLVDNGTAGRHGAEFKFRRKLERFLACKDLPVRTKCPIPMVCLVIEGGIQTIHGVVKYVSASPAVPVVVCDGSGRAADLIAYVLKSYEKGTSVNCSKPELIDKIRTTFRGCETLAEAVYDQLMKCVPLKRHISIFRPNAETDFGPMSEENDLDKLLLRAVLRSVNESDLSLMAQKQLAQALVWNRVDIARSEVFFYGQEWSEGALEEAMMYALDKNLVDFVKLLIEKGVRVNEFLTISRLEELYNSKSGPPNMLQNIMDESSLKRKKQITLIDVGLVMEKLMGGTFRSLYTKREFRSLHKKFSRLSRKPDSRVTWDNEVATFSYPFNELLIWAVLTKRNAMARLMLEHEGQVLAKALVASSLYRGMAKEAAEDDCDLELYEDFKECYSETQRFTSEFFNYCYRQDADLARKLLAVKLANCSRQNCLQLAHGCDHQELIAHPCSQRILNDIWMGGMRSRKSVNLRVIFSIIFFPLILTWEFPANGRELCALNDEEDSEESPTDQSEAQERRSTDSSTEPGIYRKFSLFYNSPITTFWADVFAYIVFLSIFTFTMLIKLPHALHWNECYVVAYIGTFGCDLIRQILVTKSAKLTRKFSIWTQNWWNILDALAVMAFFLAFTLRMDQRFFTEGRVLYCLNIVYWYMRILRLFDVSKLLGPFVTMIFTMIKMLVQFVTFLLVVIMAYGVFRQALLFPDEEKSWQSVRNVFFTPHVMIYGELLVDTIDPPCGIPGTVECIPGHWLNPIVMAGYLMISSVLLLNVLIAIFNSIYEHMKAMTHKIWKFNRYAFVVEYKKKLNLPPPLIILSHIYLIFHWCWKWDQDIDKKVEEEEKRSEESAENGDQEDPLLRGEYWSKMSTVESELEDFEAKCLRDLIRQKESEQKRNYKESSLVVNEKIDSMGRKMEKCYSSVVRIESYFNLKQTKSIQIDSIDGQLETDGDGAGRMLELPKFRQKLSQRSVPQGMLNPRDVITNKLKVEARYLQKWEEEGYDTQ